MRSSAQRFGVDLRRYNLVNSVGLTRRRLLAERQITLVLDIGANTGQYAEALRAAGYSNRIVSFEPQAAACVELERAAAGDERWQARHVALGEREGETSIHIAGNSASSSLRPMADRLVASFPELAYVAEETTRVVTLDSLRGDVVRPDDRILMKIDVQGFEREVLAGASETLRQTELLDVELSLTPLYEGQALLCELMGLLEGWGFRPFRLDPGFTDRSSGQTLQVDGLFMRAGASVGGTDGTAEPAATASQAIS